VDREPEAASIYRALAAAIEWRSKLWMKAAKAQANKRGER
jgi:hypothetical protein